MGVTILAFHTLPLAEKNVLGSGEGVRFFSGERTSRVFAYRFFVGIPRHHREVKVKRDLQVRKGKDWEVEVCCCFEEVVHSSWRATRSNLVGP